MFPAATTSSQGDNVPSQPQPDRIPKRGQSPDWRHRLIRSLSHPSWQGIGALAGALALIVTIVMIFTTVGGTGPAVSPLRSSTSPTVTVPPIEPTNALSTRACRVGPTLSVRLEANRSTLTVSGTCWPDGGQVDIYIDGNLQNNAPLPQPNHLIFAVYDLTPAERTPGDHRVVARHNPDDQNASATYHVA
jgi:hypothetical protein